MEGGGNEVNWSHPLILYVFGAAALFLMLFVFVEKHWAQEPILNLVLFTQCDATLSYLIMAFQPAAQFGASTHDLELYEMLRSIVWMMLLNSFTLDDISGTPLRRHRGHPTQKRVHICFQRSQGTLLGESSAVFASKVGPSILQKSKPS
jgi:hypothetical protein